MLVVGATGYIGKFVVRELVKRGYDVVALARERSGVGGKATRDDVQRVRITTIVVTDPIGEFEATAVRAT